MSNEPNVDELLRDVKRCIALAKITEFENQAFRLGDFVNVKLLPAAKASEILYDAALANGLVREHGDEIIQSIMAAGMKGDA
jgi:hypothetical protein